MTTEYIIDLERLTADDVLFIERMATRVTLGHDKIKTLWFHKSRPVHFLAGNRSSARIFLDNEALQLVPMLMLRLSNKVIQYELPDQHKRIHRYDEY